MNNNNIRVGNLFGIPFYVNPSWFLVLGLVAVSYGRQLALFPQLVGIIPWILGFLAALLLFFSVVVHELGHSFVALSQGINVNSITLFLFGGLASLEKESETPLESFLVAIAGPTVSLVLFAILNLIKVNFSFSEPITAIISLLTSINLILGLFNLIPGLPLDGGNILKALVWKITGNPNKGIIFASRVGQVFGWLAVFIGGLAILGISPIGNFWTLLIGFFLLQNAVFSGQSARFQETLSGYTAKDAIIPYSPVVLDSFNLREFVNNYVIGKRKWKIFLITNEEGKLSGILELNTLNKVSTSQWTELKISEIMQPINDSVTMIEADKSLLEVVKILENNPRQQLTVIHKNGIILGLLEKASIIKFLQEQTQAKAA
ncbi:MAG: site-2 protease family protein [cyanobacterium endosymbiont of Rhopalodia musculus]|uniref:site-2 protease family protein n=1 Tax=cyanobacterium endosymbiont of Epithemia clementina EcSB TaxID=3034674 RepID=UPI0024804192|nr:site-2 protease family protein [cyanobacterium endosymbiont of Epithemia clementina EcSB]WGT67834.1 site-2 protease family protein [cyanobacterium endosymbiont of Epithemia clementina EcSB]